MENLIVDNAKVMPKGQIMLPKEIRNKLGLSTGDRVTLICEGDQVVMMNAAVYAMKMLQKGMALWCQVQLTIKFLLTIFGKVDVVG